DLEPLDSFAAFLRKNDAGAVFISKVKDLSENTVMVTGIGMFFSWSWVLALNALQNSMMFRPRWPSAGPIGGDGLAAPAGTWSLIIPTIFFAILYLITPAKGGAMPPLLHPLPVDPGFPGCSPGQA